MNNVMMDVWVCLFKDESALEAYFDEPDLYEDGVPINQFTIDQGELFVDHDFIAAEFMYGADNPKELLSKYIYSSSFRELMSNEYNKAKIGPFNSIILVREEDIEAPISVRKDNYQTIYLGKFDFTNGYIDV